MPLHSAAVVVVVAAAAEAVRSQPLQGRRGRSFASAGGWWRIRPAVGRHTEVAAAADSRNIEAVVGEVLGRSRWVVGRTLLVVFGEVSRGCCLWISRGIPVNLNLLV